MFFHVKEDLMRVDMNNNFGQMTNNQDLVLLRQYPVMSIQTCESITRMASNIAFFSSVVELDLLA